jgi:hypothetical protein
MTLEFLVCGIDRVDTDGYFLWFSDVPRNSTIEDVGMTHERFISLGRKVLN